MRLLLWIVLLLAAPAALAQRSSGTIEAAPGITLFYEKIGSGPELVIVPGGFLYDGALDSLATPGRTLLLYDMRNRGRSSPVDDAMLISIEADVADLEAVRRHLGADRFKLIGWSYLGLMTALYAAEHPGRVERLVQLGPVPMKWDAPLPEDLRWKDSTPVVPAAVEAELKALRDSGFHRTSPQEYCLRHEAAQHFELVGNPANAARIDDARRCAMRNEWPVNFWRHLEWHFIGSVQKFEPPRARLAALAIPVLTIHGTRDRNARFAGGAEWALTFPDARLIVSHGAAHALWLDDPQAVPDIDRFLAGQWPARAQRVRSYGEVRKLLPEGL